MTLLPLAEARKNRPRFDWHSFKAQRPRKLGVFTVEPARLDRIVELIDWRYFLKAWELPAVDPAEMKEKGQRAEALRLLEDARIILRQMEESGKLRLRGVYGLFPAEADLDDLVVYADEKRTKVKTRLHFLRQQKKMTQGINLSLADFIAPSGSEDYIGAFAVSARGCEDLCSHLAAGDHFRELMIKILCDRLAEAMAEWLHREVRTLHWGYAADESLPVQDLLAGRYRGIRPAPGYPPCPDHLEKETLLFTLLDAEKNAGIRLSESKMMIPAASVCGYYLAHPDSHAFSVGPIASDQLAEYARRTGRTEDRLKRFLANEIVPDT